jgi:Rha family phage regulatory protein
MEDSNLNELPVPVVRVHDGKMVVDSRNVAEVFLKRHFHVLQAIRDLECPPDFRASNFRVFEIQGLSDPNFGKAGYCEMTRDGFMFLAMGFTGPLAGRWATRYWRCRLIEAASRSWFSARSICSGTSD